MNKKQPKLIEVCRYTWCTRSQDKVQIAYAPPFTNVWSSLRAPLLNQLILKCLAIPGQENNEKVSWKHPIFRTKYHPTGGTYQANTEIWLQFAPLLLVQFSELVRQVRNRWRSFWVTTSFWKVVRHPSTAAKSWSQAPVFPPSKNWGFFHPKSACER